MDQTEQDDFGLPPETVERLKAAHPGLELHVLQAVGQTIVVRAPSLPAWRKFQSDGSSDNKQTKMIAGENLVGACIVYPDASGWEAMKLKFPAIATTFAGDLLELAGLDRDSKKKRLT